MTNQTLNVTQILYHTTKQCAVVSIQLICIVYPEKFIRDNVIAPRFYYFPSLLSVSRKRCILCYI